MPIMRSPKLVAEKIRQYVEGKVYCEIGCGSGAILEEVVKFARSATGIELNIGRFNDCKNKGLYVIRDDIFTMELPKADVYYCWIAYDINKKIYSMIKDAILIIGAEEYVPEEMQTLKELQPKETIIFDFDEGEGKREKGVFHLGVFYR